MLALKVAIQDVACGSDAAEKSNKDAWTETGRCVEGDDPGLQDMLKEIENRQGG